jgi:hypothetical protein
MREEVEVLTDGFDEALAIFERLVFAPALTIAIGEGFRLGRDGVVVTVEGSGLIESR